jgi:hypothetical protein
MKDEFGQNYYAVPAFDDGADTSWTQDIARECGVSGDKVVDVIACYQERHETDRSPATGAKNEVGIEKFSRLMISFKNARMGNHLLLYALDSRTLDDVLGNRNGTDFSRMFDCTKQAINKALAKIQRELNLPPRKDQRETASRKTMSNKRKSQLKTQ